MGGLDYSTVHFIGIGGSGMCGLARILLQMGIRVSGSDLAASESTRRLQAIGATIDYTQTGAIIGPDTDLVVYSAAIRPDHLERRLASERGIKQRKYAEVVGMLTTLRKTVAIAGTHGKTTTTNMTATLLRESGLRPGWIVGGMPLGLPESSHWDGGVHLVLEACEYDRSFLNFSPATIVLHNIEPDHMDYFGTIDNLCGTFRDFVGKLANGGTLLANADDDRVLQVVRKSGRDATTYGTGADCDYRMVSHECDEDGTRLVVHSQGKPWLDALVPVPGRVNALNALAASVAAHVCGVPVQRIKAGLAKVRGVGRRFERVGDWNGVPVIDDYAHHPTAVRELVQTARKSLPGRRLTFIFQAHQYARLTGFFDEFRDALAGVDRVIVCPTFAAREEGDIVRGEPEERLAASLRKRGVDATSCAGFDDVLADIASSFRPNQAIVTVGAGDVTRLGPRILALEAPLLKSAV